MKKQLILVGGAMGVGKSAVCRELLRQLTPGVWLDGDWCWNMNPFVVSEENKRMVLSNITHLLRAYLNNSSYRYVLFCWVMDQPLLFLPRRPVPSGPVPAFAGPGGDPALFGKTPFLRMQRLRRRLRRASGTSHPVCMSAVRRRQAAAGGFAG